MNKQKTYRWNGKHGKGAMRAYRNQKRIDAELRNEVYFPKEKERQMENYLQLKNYQRAAGVRVENP